MTTKTLDVATAEKNAIEAQATAESLERALKSGDLSITPATVRTAHAKAVDAQLLLEGARAAQVRADAEDLEHRGNDLYDQFREDQKRVFEDLESRVAQFLQTTGGLLDSLTTYNDNLVGYKRKWNDLFAGNTELPAAVQFKADHSSSRSFGNLGPGQVARHVDPMQLLVALLSEATRGFSGQLGGIDRELRMQLSSGGYANGLKSLRELRRQFDKGKEGTE